MNTAEEIQSLLDKDRLNIELPLTKDEALDIENKIRRILKHEKERALFHLKILTLTFIVAVIAFVVFWWNDFGSGFTPMSLIISIIIGIILWCFTQTYFDNNDEDYYFRDENEYFINNALENKDKRLALYVHSVSIQERVLTIHERRFLITYIEKRDEEKERNKINQQISDLLKS